MIMKRIISLVMCFLVLWTSVSYATWTSTTSSKWNTPILSNSLQFTAALDNWKVYMNWTSFYQAVDVNEDFKYYKIVRSQSVSDPVYPDQWYIRYESDISTTSYTDKWPRKWINYYRVCAMTYAKNRYCSNVVKVNYVTETTSSNNNNDYSTSKTEDSTKTSTTTTVKKTTISASLQIRANNTLSSFYKKLEYKYEDSEKRISVMNSIIKKLNALKSKKSSLAPLIEYMIEGMEERKEKYQNEFDELESIFENF